MKKLSLLAAFLLTVGVSQGADLVTSIDETFARLGSTSGTDDKALAQRGNAASVNPIIKLYDWTNTAGTGYIWGGYVPQASSTQNPEAQIRTNGTDSMGLLRFKWKAVYPQTRAITRFDNTTIADFSTAAADVADNSAHKVDASGTDAGIRLIIAQNPHTEALVTMKVLIHVEGDKWYLSNTAKTIPNLVLADAPVTIDFPFAGTDNVKWDACNTATNADLTVKAMAHAAIVTDTTDGSAAPVLSAIDGMGVVVIDAPTGTAQITVPDYNAAGSFLYIDHMILSPDIVASPPTDLVATAAPDALRISLAWTAAADAVKYNVYRATVEAGPYTKVNTTDVTGTTYDDETVAENTTYYYKLTALDAATPANESVQSASASATSAQLSSVEDWNVIE